MLTGKQKIRNLFPKSLVLVISLATLCFVLLITTALTTALLVKSAQESAALRAKLVPKEASEKEKTGENTVVSDRLKDARFFAFDPSHGGMALDEDAYLYSGYGAPILKYLGHFQPGLTMRLENFGYGNVVVIETPDETKNYLDQDTGELLATYRSYDLQDGTSSGFLANNLIGGASIGLMASCSQSPGNDGELTAVAVNRANKITITLPVEDRVPVHCAKSADGEVRYGAVSGGPTPYGYKSAVIDPQSRKFYVSVGLGILTVSLPTGSTGSVDVALEPTHKITPTYGGFTLRAPASVPICLASEGGPACERYPVGDWVEPAATEYVGGFIGLQSLDVLRVTSALAESGADFGKRSLALNRQYGQKDAVYSDERDTTVDGALAFSFIVKNVFEERGGLWGKKGYEDDPSFNPKDQMTLDRSIRVIYFDHGGNFFRVMYAADDEVADRIMRTWKWLPTKK